MWQCYWFCMRVYDIFSPDCICSRGQGSQHETVKVGFFAMDGYHMMDEEGTAAVMAMIFLRLMALVVGM